MQPTRPKYLSEQAERTLQALAAAGLGHTISLPLDGITDPDQRMESESLRTWFSTEFSDALLD